MKRDPLLRTFLTEMLRVHHADLIVVITGIGFWIADHAEVTEPSLWGIGVIVVLGLYLFYIVGDACLNTSALRGVVEIPYSIVTDKSFEQADQISGNHFNVLVDQKIRLPRIFARFLIAGSDWRYFDQNRAPSDRFRDLVREIRTHFNRLSKRVTAKNARYHFFFVTAPVIALGLGAVLGRDIRAKAYQLFGPEHFAPVFDPEAADPNESYHGLQKQSTTDSRISIDRTGDDKAQDEAILLQFVGHPLSPPRRADGNQFASTVTVKHAEYIRHLPEEENWTRLAADIASMVLEEVSSGKHVHLFVGLPSALAFAVGHFLGDHNEIQIYHFEKKSTNYEPAYSLNQLA